MILSPQPTSTCALIKCREWCDGEYFRINRVCWKGVLWLALEIYVRTYVLTFGLMDGGGSLYWMRVAVVSLQLIRMEG